MQKKDNDYRKEILLESWQKAFHATPGPSSSKEIFFLWLKGFAMGTADLIPGVSGGTIAFITGIYEKLLAAIASLTRHAFYDLARFKFISFVSQVHIKFILILGYGVLSAIFLLARAMHYLLTTHPEPTWGLFFGLIFASFFMIWRQINNPLQAHKLLMIALGAIVAFFFVGMIPVETPDQDWFIFLCGVIGISAMVLPGISGSFLLLILGKYEFITSALKNPFIATNFQTLFVFACGAFTGLLGFSKILNWLMREYRAATMAFLTGILLGSLRKVWPWKEVLETRLVGGKERIIREANILPTQWESTELLTVSTMIIGLLLILALEYHRTKKEA